MCKVMCMSTRGLNQLLHMGYISRDNYSKNLSEQDICKLWISRTGIHQTLSSVYGQSVHKFQLSNNCPSFWKLVARCFTYVVYYRFRTMACKESELTVGYTITYGVNCEFEINLWVNCCIEIVLSLTFSRWWLNSDSGATFQMTCITSTIMITMDRGLCSLLRLWCLRCKPLLYWASCGYS